MVLGSRDMEILADIAIKIAKEAWEKSFGKGEDSLSPEVIAAKIRAVDNISTEILKHWLKKGVHPNNLEKRGK